MSSKQLIEQLSVILADTYALYLKTQNYHWHVRGPNFKTLHVLFEEHYTALADAVDDIAERILTLGHHAPATFNDFNRLKTITDGDSRAHAEQMLEELHADHCKVSTVLKAALEMAAKENDEGTVALLSERIAAHEKMSWMLDASRA